MLIDTFINAIFLYDDKMLITFNYKDGTKTITFGEAKEAAEKAASGSDLDCSPAPKVHRNFDRITVDFFYCFATVIKCKTFDYHLLTEIFKK